MAARDIVTNRVTDPTPRDKDGKPTDPHIGGTVITPNVPEIRQSGFAQGGTSNPPQGWDGESRQLDNDGKPSGQRSPMSTYDTFKTADEVLNDPTETPHAALDGDPRNPAKVESAQEPTVTDLTDDPRGTTQTTRPTSNKKG